MNQAALIEQLRQSTSFLWLVLALVWVVSALRTKRTVQSQSSASQLLYTAILVVGVYMIFAKQSRIPWLDRQLFPVTVPIVLAGRLVVLIGVAFSIWARLILGSNWSNRVTVKENHTLVRTGPYRIVRHPIYSGILLGMLGSALQRGGTRCFAGVLICGLSFWLKTRAEERFMVQSFGEEYLQYRHKVKALAPFIFWQCRHLDRQDTARIGQNGYASPLCTPPTLNAGSVFLTVNEIGHVGSGVHVTQAAT